MDHKKHQDNRINQSRMQKAVEGSCIVAPFPGHSGSINWEEKCCPLKQRQGTMGSRSSDRVSKAEKKICSSSLLVNVDLEKHLSSLPACSDKKSMKSRLKLETPLQMLRESEKITRETSLHFLEDDFPLFATTGRRAHSADYEISTPNLMHDSMSSVSTMSTCALFSPRTGGGAAATPSSSSVSTNRTKKSVRFAKEYGRSGVVLRDILAPPLTEPDDVVVGGSSQQLRLNQEKPHDTDHMVVRCNSSDNCVLLNYSRRKGRRKTREDLSTSWPRITKDKNHYNPAGTTLREAVMCRWESGARSDDEPPRLPHQLLSETSRNRSQHDNLPRPLLHPPQRLPSP